MKLDRAEARPPLLNRLLWFLAIWAASTSALAIAALLIRGLMRMAGLAG